uniref:Predicted protein n=1 Tax=Physcomitrium patens TaxID=3218 RepID=A9U485_PHYPA
MQLMGEIGMSHAIDARICRDEEEVDIGYKQPTNEKNGYNQRVGDIEEPIVALVDHGFEINLMSKDLYKKKKWPIDMEHGWAIRAANNTWGELYGACPDEVLSRDEGAFDASFIGILENGNIMYKKVDDFKRKERKRLYDIEGQLRKIGTLQDDERILGVYEDNGLEDSLELITSIGLGDNDKIVEIHSREVYTMLESFQAPEVTVETRYKTADKKVKPVAGPLPEDSKEQMEEASKEASLRDPMSIGHQFTEETFEELKIGSDGSLLPEEITCFKKMLGKQGRSFAFESHEIGYLEYWEHRPTPAQILSGQIQSPRYSQPGHSEMLRSILITGVSRMRRTNSHDGFEEPIGSNFENPIQVLLLNMRPVLVGQPNAV